jgi:hypothetical protein
MVAGLGEAAIWQRFAPGRSLSDQLT